MTRGGRTKRPLCFADRVKPLSQSAHVGARRVHGKIAGIFDDASGHLFQIKGARPLQHHLGDLTLAFKAGPYGGRSTFDRTKAGGAPSGPLNWGHDHNDDMSFWLWGSGTWLAPEAAGYDAGNNTGYALAQRANMTSFHNGLLIDGNGQLGDVRSSDDEWNNPWFFSRDAAPLLTPTGTADYAVAGGRGASLFDASVGLSRWDRLVVLARKRYALVHDDLAAAAPHDFDWVCHFPDGVSLDGSGWVQGAARNGMSLGVRVVSPTNWSAATGTQSGNLTSLFEPDGSISYVRVRPSAPSAAMQFLAALVPVQTSAWASRVPIDALSSSDTGAGAVVAAGSALEERWIFGRAGGDGKAAGDLALTGSLAGMAGRSSGTAVRALLIGPGKLADQGGTRELLSSQSARSIEADLQGTTLVVSGEGIADFRAYAPTTTAVRLNGQPVSATLLDGAVHYPPLTTTPASDGGTDESGGTFIDGGSYTGAPGQTPSFPHGALSCSTGGGAAAGLELALLLGLAALLRRRRD